MLIDEARRLSVKISKEKEDEIRKHLFGEAVNTGNSGVLSNVNNNKMDNSK